MHKASACNLLAPLASRVQLANVVANILGVDHLALVHTSCLSMSGQFVCPGLRQRLAQAECHSCSVAYARVDVSLARAAAQAAAARNASDTDDRERPAGGETY